MKNVLRALLVMILMATTLVPFTGSEMTAQDYPCINPAEMEAAIGVPADGYADNLQSGICEMVVVASDRLKTFTCPEGWFCYILERREGHSLPWLVAQGGTGQVVRGYGGRFVFFWQDPENPPKNFCGAHGTLKDTFPYLTVAYRPMPGWPERCSEYSFDIAAAPFESYLNWDSDLADIPIAGPPTPTTLSVEEVIGWCEENPREIYGPQGCDPQYFSQTEPNIVHYESLVAPQGTGCPNFPNAPWYVEVDGGLVLTDRTHSYPPCRLVIWIR